MAKNNSVLMPYANPEDLKEAKRRWYQQRYKDADFRAAESERKAKEWRKLPGDKKTAAKARAKEAVYWRREVTKVLGAIAEMPATRRDARRRALIAELNEQLPESGKSPSAQKTKRASADQTKEQNAKPRKASGRERVAGQAEKPAARAPSQ